ncbi:hypothetical protein EDD15DRAFT_2194623 [Pisolithus albus]|nr:hypothetical protein EDD15DRAFT_2194623 [Pisolithus albus]
MAFPIRITPAVLNDAAFAFLEQHARGEISDMVALTKIDLELHLTGLKFEQEQWLDLFGVILLDPAEGLNSIKTARQLAQATTNPLLEDPAAWQLVLRWAADDDNISFPDFLAEMEGKFKDRYKFDDWKTIFDQVFEASRDGTAVEVVRAAMTERGVLDRSSVQDLSVQSSSSANVSSTRPSGRASSSRSRKTSRKSKGPRPPAKRAKLSGGVRQFLDTSAQDGDDDESEDESDRDSEMHRSPRVTEIAPSGRTTFNKRLERIFDHYNREGSAEGSNARVYRSPVRSAEVGMDVDVDPIESRVYMIELPTVHGAGFVLEHLRRRGMSCQTFQSVPRRIFVEARFPLEVQLGLPPSHADLVREIIRIPREQMRSVTEPCDIPARSWVRIRFGSFKNDIAYVLSVEDSSVETLIVPRSLPYYSDAHSPVEGRSLFDVELAREHGLEVTVSTNDRGHPVAYCDGSEYHFGCCRISFPKKWVKVVGVPSPDEIAWFAVASVDPSLVDRTLTRFSTRWWQEGDTGRICSGEFANKLARIVAVDLQCESVTVHVLTDNSSDDVGLLEISVHDFNLEFRIGASVKVIGGIDCGFQGMVISRRDDIFLLQGSDQQASHDLVKYHFLLMSSQVEVPGILLASYIPPTTYASRADDQVRYDPLANENRLQPGDLVRVVRGPHKDRCGTLHYYSGRELLVTPSAIQEKSTADPGDKGKSKAEEADARGDGNVDEFDDLIQISVCMDDAVVIPPNTLQFSKERGYDVTIGDRVRVARGPALGVEGPVRTVDIIAGRLTVVSEDGPWHDVPIGFCVKVQDYSLRDVERHVGREVWIISGPSKGYRGTLRSVGRTTCQVAIHSGVMQLKHTAVVTESGVLLNGAPLDPARMAAFIELRRTSFVPTAPPRHITPPPPSPVADPSAEPGPSTSAYNPWVVHPGDVTPRRSNETEQQQVDYGCVPWLFDDNFCDYPKWHVCLRVGLAYNRGSLEKRVVRTTAPDRFSTVTRGCGLAPPGHVSVTVTSSTVSANIEHHFIPARDLTPAKPTSAGQSCLILRGKLAGQIHLVKKCQSKKAPKGVELEDGTKLPFEDVCQVIPVNQVI